MKRVMLTPELRAQLGGLDQYFEVYDEVGTRVGHYLPMASYVEMICDAFRDGTVNDDELRRIVGDAVRDGDAATAEILARVVTDLARLRGDDESDTPQIR